MAQLSTHILNTTLGRPAPQVSITLEQQEGSDWKFVATHSTDDDGRVSAFLPAGVTLNTGNYRLTFQTGTYFKAIQTEGFYPEVTIAFEVTQPNEHHHVPLLLNPFGYSTYRGS
jgi:5-hydroxyisourate hydrolase